jgi:hypothetical protein
MFKFITEEVIDSRKKGVLPDEHGNNPTPEMKAAGTVAKLYGNSCYGKCLTNIEKHDNISLVHGSEAEAMINSPLFTKLDPVDKGGYHICIIVSFCLHCSMRFAYSFMLVQPGYCQININREVKTILRYKTWYKTVSIILFYIYLHAGHSTGDT